jgi:hypothetical protein
VEASKQPCGGGVLRLCGEPGVEMFMKKEPLYLYLLNSLSMMNALDALDSPACLVSKQSFTLL